MLVILRKRCPDIQILRKIYGNSHSWLFLLCLPKWYVMLYVFVRYCSDLSCKLPFDVEIRPQLTYIDFQSVSDNCLADQIGEKLPETTVEYRTDRDGRYGPSNTRRCPYPPYEVLNVLELHGYKVLEHARLTVLACGHCTGRLKMQRVYETIWTATLVNT